MWAGHFIPCRGASTRVSACAWPTPQDHPSAALPAGQQCIHLPRRGPRRRADAVQGDQASVGRHGRWQQPASLSASLLGQLSQELAPTALPALPRCNPFPPAPSQPLPAGFHCRSDDVFLAAAEALASMSSVAQLEQGHLFPAFAGIKAVSAHLIATVADFMVRAPPARRFDRVGKAREACRNVGAVTLLLALQGQMGGGVLRRGVVAPRPSGPAPPPLAPSGPFLCPISAVATYLPRPCLYH